MIRKNDIYNGDKEWMKQDIQSSNSIYKRKYKTYCLPNFNFLIRVKYWVIFSSRCRHFWRKYFGQNTKFSSICCRALTKFRDNLTFSHCFIGKKTLKRRNENFKSHLRWQFYKLNFLYKIIYNSCTVLKELLYINCNIISIQHKDISTTVFIPS